jgi:hypothetical protein
MAVSTVGLTETEQQLADRIEFDALKIRGGVEEVEVVYATVRELASGQRSRQETDTRPSALTGTALPKSFTNWRLSAVCSSMRPVRSSIA